MDVGIPVPNIQLPSGKEAILRVAEAAEELGFHSIWLGDHIVRPFIRSEPGGPPEPRAPEDRYGPSLYWEDMYEPLVTASWLAAQTDRVKIGFGVLVLPYRNPVLCAKMLASLDQLSDGRLIVGVGVGSWTPEYRALGIPRVDTGRKADDYIRFFHEVWESEDPLYEGEFVEFKDTVFKPRPAQDHIPIWIGGGSDAALRRAVELADGWHWHTDYDGMRPLVAKLHAMAEERGRDLSDFTISNRPVVRFAEHVRLDERGYGGRNAAIVGPPDHIVGELRRMEEDLGVTHLVPDLHEGESLDVILDAMARLQEEVVPYL